MEQKNNINVIFERVKHYFATQGEDTPQEIIDAFKEK